VVAAPVIYEDHGWSSLLPLTYSRSTMQLTCGSRSLLDRLARLAAPAGLWCRAELATLVAEQTGLVVNRPVAAPALFLNGRGIWWQLPEHAADEVPWVGTIGGGDRVGGRVVCLFADAELTASLTPEALADPTRLDELVGGCNRRDVTGCVDMIDWPWQLVGANRRCLLADWEAAGAGRSRTGQVDGGAHLLAPDAISLGAGSRVKPGAVIDAELGPVIIDDRVTVMPHAYIQGPCAIGNDALVQPGTVVHEDTAIGAHCKIGGEIEASIIQAFSNKQHDGFLGHSYVGSWVNIGADAVTSDLKNTYGTVRVPINGRAVDSGELFLGSIIGDHGKIGIGVNLPTGAVVGFASNVLVTRCPAFVPSFSWLDGGGGACDLDRAVAVAMRMMQRRGQRLSAAEEEVFRAIPELATELEQPA